MLLVCRQIAALALVISVAPQSRAANEVLGLADIEKAELAALNARKAVKNCELVISWSAEGFKAGVAQAPRTGETYYLIDGKKRLQRKKLVSTTDTPVYFIQCLHCTAQDYFVNYMDQGGHMTAAAFSRMKSTDPKNAMWRTIPNPLLIGYVWHEYVLFYEGNMQTMVARPDRTDLAGVRELLDGKETIRISHKPTATTKVSFWISPKEGNSIVRIVLEGGESKYVSVFSQRFHAESGLWFPQSYVIDEFRNSELAERRKATIVVKSLNGGIPPERFDVENIGLPDGTQITGRPTAGGVEVLDGDKLVDRDVYTTLEAERASERNTAKWLKRGAIVAGCFGLLGLLQYLWVRHRRRQAGSGDPHAPGNVAT